MRAVQLRMARAALGWGVRKLAEKAGVTANTVTRIENGADAKQSTLDALQRALEAAGVEFIDGGQPGVRMKENYLEVIGVKAPRPFRIGDRVRYQAGKEPEQLRSSPRLIGVVIDPPDGVPTATALPWVRFSGLEPLMENPGDLEHVDG
jgi:transcriptional regulator with XRE-family HTH domain